MSQVINDNPLPLNAATMRLYPPSQSQASLNGISQVAQPESLKKPIQIDSIFNRMGG